MKSNYVKFTEFNLWANRRYAEAFGQLPDAVMEQHVVSSFPSAKATFLHIWDAEYLWLRRLQGIAPNAFPSKTFEGNMAAVYRTVLAESEAFRDFVSGQPPSFFEEKIKYRTLAYGEGESLAWEMVHHCMNHSTFHRGQLVTIGRQLGLQKFPPVDFVFFLRE